MEFRLGPALALPLTWLAFALAAADGVRAADLASETDSMVQAALQAEVDGDQSVRRALLAQARQQDPKHPAARWHAGYVQIDDRWLTIEDAEFNTVAKGVVAEYRRLRELYSGSLAGELSLARWCRAGGLHEQERLHLAKVLQLDRRNMEARNRLGLKEYGGRLLTDEQINHWKRAQQQYARALRTWNPRLRRWRREIENSDPADQTEAWRELTEVDDPQAVPALELICHSAGVQLQQQIVYVLGQIGNQAATDALVRLSVGSESSVVRQAAAQQLGERSWYGFVPNLLGRLQTPVECRYFLQAMGTGVFSQVRFTQEQANAVVNVSQSVNAQFPIRLFPPSRQQMHFGRVLTQGSTINTETLLAISDAVRLPGFLARHQRRVEEEAFRQYRTVLESLHAVRFKNAQASMLNERIYAALHTSTGQQIKNEPQQWWRWWQEYNELEASEEKPEIKFRNSQTYAETMVYESRLMSCFASGTVVWTELGPVSIENVKPGDRVLSQDPDSGELSYRIVLDTTIRAPSPTLRIQVAAEQIEATLGHPVWVVGGGWKMAKELNVGDQLHGLRGSVAVDKIKSGPTVEAHNLVVADSQTYFVGKHRLLVHDNTPRRALNVPLPGWAARP